jgi:hypothetical protein
LAGGVNVYVCPAATADLKACDLLSLEDKDGAADRGRLEAREDEGLVVCEVKVDEVFGLWGERS